MSGQSDQIVRSQTCARMQRGEPLRNYHGIFTRFAPNARCTLCSAARSSVTVPSVTALVLGSIVSLLLADDRLGTSKDVRLQLINTMLAEYYDQHPGTHRLPPLRLANVFSGGWADLHGLATKAANTRAAVFVFEVCAIVGLTEGR